MLDRSLIPVRHPDGSVALDQEEFSDQNDGRVLAGLEPVFDKYMDLPLIQDRLSEIWFIVA